eukprot:scaffold55875_cov26-Tisochrysis_lutea.AAC.2
MTCGYAVRSSSSLLALRMPLPPPPSDALSMTGVELVLRQRAVGLQVGGKAISIPWHRGDARLLGEEDGADLVTEHAHDRRGRADKGDLAAQLLRLLLEHLPQLGVLRGVAPADKDGIHILRDAKVDNELHVGVVVRIGAAWHLDKLVGATDEFGVGGEVLRRCHRHELDGVLVAEGLVGPLLDGHDGLGGRHAVVGDEDAADQRITAAILDVFPHALFEVGLVCVRLGRRQLGDRTYARNTWKGGERRDATSSGGLGAGRAPLRELAGIGVRSTAGEAAPGATACFEKGLRSEPHVSALALATHASSRAP